MRNICGLALVAFSVSLLASCVPLIESTFYLSDGCRVPRWILLPAGMKREDISLKMNTYVGWRERYSNYILYDLDGREINSTKVSGEGGSPISILDNEKGKVALFDFEVSNGIIDVIRYDVKRNGGEFCPVDDVAVLEKIDSIRKSSPTR